MAKVNPEIRFKDAGIGIMAKGNKAVSQFTIEAKTTDGMKYEVPGICIYEFKNDKIQQHWSVSDRLSAAKQGAKGTVDKRVISTVVNRMEKGLR